MTLPGWESVETTATIAQALHIVAVFVLGLLFLSEGLALVYEFRTENLNAMIDGARMMEQQQKDARYAAELAALRAKAQARTITPEQRSRLVAYLSKASPKGDIEVIWKRNDSEAQNFGNQVIAVLNDAGFHAREVTSPTSFDVTGAGAWIVARDLAKLQREPNAVGAIQNAFRDICGIFMDGTQRKDPFPDLGEVVIAIGAKPS
jgi:hypothetical protein